MSDSHISTTPASIQGLKVDNLNSIWEHFKNPKKMLQFSIFHFYSGARKKSGQYWYVHHMMILEEHKNEDAVIFFIFHISHSIQGLGVDNIGRSTSTALKETAADTYYVCVYVC